MMKTLIALIFLLYSVALSSQERITLLFVGDLMQHRAQIDAARTSDGTYDYSSYFSLVKEEISRADIAIGNLEVTLGGKPYRGYPAFSAPDEYLQTIIVWIAARQGWNEPSHKSTPSPYPMQALTGTLPNVNNAILFSSGKKVSV